MPKRGRFSFLGEPQGPLWLVLTCVLERTSFWQEINAVDLFFLANTMVFGARANARRSSATLTVREVPGNPNWLKIHVQIG